jgi:hypothetical protein
VNSTFFAFLRKGEKANGSARNQVSEVKARDRVLASSSRGLTKRLIAARKGQSEDPKSRCFLCIHSFLDCGRLSVGSEKAFLLDVFASQQRILPELPVSLPSQLYKFPELRCEPRWLPKVASEKHCEHPDLLLPVPKESRKFPGKTSKAAGLLDEFP